MRDKLIELLIKSGVTWNPCGVADSLLENGVVALPCKIGQTVYKIEPLWYETFGAKKHKCFNCEHYYEGGYCDPAECGLGNKCCYHIKETKSDLRHIGDWIEPNVFTKEIAWGKTVFLTREEAEQALAEVANAH